MELSIAGWSHTPFGRLDQSSVETLLGEVIEPCLEHAGVDAADVDEVFVGHFNAGFCAQDFTAGLIPIVAGGLRFKPVTRVENACATGSAAVHCAARSLLSGRAKRVLVVGVEHMSGVSGEEVGRNLLKASYLREEAAITGGFAGVFAKIAQEYSRRYSDPSEALAHIAAKNHHNGAGNPFAQIRKDLGVEFCRTVSDRNPIVAGSLRRTDCSPVSDGAAALLLTSEPADARRSNVRMSGLGHAQDAMPMSRRDILAFEGCTVAWHRALEEAGVTLGDLSFIETHDCFTIAELLEYEAMGLAAAGQGGRLALDGATAIDGRLPVNPSGGLKSKGHPIGATGVSMHVMSAMQLAGVAPEAIQIRDAKRAGIFNMGGAAVANYASILSAVH